MMGNKDSFFKQESWSNSLEFDFQPDELKYSAKLGNTKTTTEIPYTAISRDKWELHEKKTGFRNVGAVWIVIGILFELPTIIRGEFSFPIWFTLGALTLIFYFLVQTEFIVIESERGRIFVIKDEKQETIQKLIFKKRSEALKKIYGQIDYTSESEMEKRKFDILLKEEVITFEERDEAHKNIDAHQQGKLIPSPFPHI